MTQRTPVPFRRSLVLFAFAASAAFAGAHAQQGVGAAAAAQKLVQVGPCSSRDECPNGCSVSTVVLDDIAEISGRAGGLPNIAVPRFDPALGELRGVKIALEAQALGWKYQFASLGSIGCIPGRAEGCPVSIVPQLSTSVPVAGATVFSLGERRAHWPTPGSGVPGTPLFCEPGLGGVTSFTGNAGICGQDLQNAPFDDPLYGPGCPFTSAPATLLTLPPSPPCASQGLILCAEQNGGVGRAYFDGANLVAWRISWPDGAIDQVEYPCIAPGQPGFSEFVGAGSWVIQTQDLEVGSISDVPALTQGPGGNGQCGNYSHSRVVKIRLEATVTYYYCPDNEPPQARPDAATVCRALDVAEPPNGDCPTFVDIPVLANDCDDDQGAPDCFGAIVCSTLAVTQPPAHGTYEIVGCDGTSQSDCPNPPLDQCAGCVVRYYPDANYVGTDTFCYTVQDDRQQTSNPAAVSIRVCPPPVAADDLFTTCSGSAITFNVFANDAGAPAVASAANGVDCGPGSPTPLPFPACPATTIDCASLEILVQPANGMLSTGQACGGLPAGCGACPGANCLRYTPQPGYCGDDVFWYRLRDGNGCCDVAKVTIRVFAPPIACDDAAVTCEADSCGPDECVLIPILDNDRTCPSTGGQCEGVPCAGCPGVPSPIDCASVVITEQPPAGCGTVLVDEACAGEPNGGCKGACVRFCPAPGFRGMCTFKYRVADQRIVLPGACQTDPFPCESNEATVTVDFRCKPDAGDDAACDESVETLDTIVIDVLDNDYAGDSLQTCADAALAPIPISLDLTGVEPGACECPGPTKGTATVFLDPADNRYKIEYVQTQPLLPGEVDQFCYKVTNVYPDGTTCCDVACVRVSLCSCEERNRQECGSLLLYAEYDTTPGNRTLFTVTDACCEEPGDTRVEFVFIDESNCLEFNRTFTLTPCDTLTFLVDAAAVPPSRGYAYAFAKSATTGPNNPNGVPIVRNRLIGQLLRMSALDDFQYSLNAVSFKGYGPEGAFNDDDQDGIRDLNGSTYPAGDPKTPQAMWEYDAAPEEILIPRFLGQGDPAAFDSQIVLIALSGGGQFDTTIDIKSFNDNESMTSGQYEFRCWARVPLATFHGGTLQSQLLIGDDDDEIFGWPPPKREAGWLLLDGLSASSTAEEILDPAIYAVLIERVGARHAATLPFEICSQKNGDLLPQSTFGDGPNPMAGDNQ